MPAVVTNPDGTYRVKDMQPGTYRVLVKRFPGAAGELPKYATVEAGLTVTVTGGVQRQDFELVP